MRHIYNILIAAMMAVGAVPVTATAAAPGAENTATTRQQRKAVSEGNKLYNEGRYAEAAALYQKAVDLNPAAADAARFNLASAKLREAATLDGDKAKEMNAEAVQMFSQLADHAQQADVRVKSNIDLGNVSYNAQDYAKAIEYYKQALRTDPDSETARRNLRQAQLKLQQQQQNKDQNKDQDKDQNKDQQKDKEQNKDQDKDKDQDQNKDQNKDQDNKDNQQQPPQPQNSISDENARKILKAMENEENATRQRMNDRRNQASGARGVRGNPW